MDANLNHQPYGDSKQRWEDLKETIYNWIGKQDTKPQRLFDKHDEHLWLLIELRKNAVSLPAAQHRERSTGQRLQL